MKIKEFIKENEDELRILMNLGNSLPRAIYKVKTKGKELNKEELTDFIKDLSDIITCDKEYIKELEENIEECRVLEKEILAKI